MRIHAVLLTLSLAGPAAAQHSHSTTENSFASPQETGQSAFAAVAEIVELLRANPETDWAQVDIAGLRRHLVDMDLLTTEAEVTRGTQSGTIRFEIRGELRTLEAIRSMVPAHAPFLANETGWDVKTEKIDEGVALYVSGDTEQIQGLGFFGLMTIGAHHQEHHLAIARSRISNH